LIWTTNDEVAKENNQALSVLKETVGFCVTEFVKKVRRR